MKNIHIAIKTIGEQGFGECPKLVEIGCIITNKEGEKQTFSVNLPTEGQESFNCRKVIKRKRQEHTYKEAIEEFYFFLLSNNVDRNTDLFWIDRGDLLILNEHFRRTLQVGELCNPIAIMDINTANFTLNISQKDKPSKGNHALAFAEFNSWNIFQQNIKNKWHY